MKMKYNITDFINKKVNNLRIIEQVCGVDKIRKGFIYVLCECNCGNFTIKSFFHIASGRTKCCGCSINSKLHGVWTTMKSRCFNKNNISYYRYGGRGISVCKKWSENFLVFYNWAISNGYKEGLEIDRKDNDIGYQPNNCRFIEKIVNCNNRSTNVFVIIENKKITLSDACRMYGVSDKYKVVHQRMNRDNLDFFDAIKF